MSIGRTITDADMLQHLGKSLRAQWRQYCRQVKECRRRFSEGTVHDSRVVARRLISTLALLETFLSRSQIRKSSKTLKSYLDIFGDLRDTQVQIASVKPLAKQYPEMKRFQRWLKQREHRFDRKAARTVKRFKLKSLRRAMAAFEKELRQCRRETTPKAASRRMRQSLARAYSRVADCQRQVKPAELDTIHKTRIAFKRFRYMVETLAPLLGITQKDCAAMHNFQTLLGDIQDQRVLLEVFEKFLCGREKLTARLDPARVRLQSEQRRLLRVYLRKAGRLQRFRPPLAYQQSRPETRA